MVERLEAKYEALYDEDGQGDLRFILWTEALEKGMDAAMLGLGPGPHLTSKAMEASAARTSSRPTTLRSICLPKEGYWRFLRSLWLYASTTSRDHES